jgi:hypothetical protein
MSRMIGSNITSQKDLALVLQKHRGLVAATIVICVALLIRVRFIDDGLWINEVVSVEAARLSFGRLLQRVGFFDISPPFYYLVLSFYSSIVGESEVALRSFSLLCALGTFVVLYFWGKRTSPWTAFGAVALLAFSTWHTHYSVEVRHYALTTFLVTLLMFNYERLINTRQPGWSLWGRLLLFEVCLLYSDYLASLLILCLNVHFFTTRRFSQTRLFRWSMVQGLALGTFAFWIPLGLIQMFQLPDLEKTAPIKGAALQLAILFFSPGPVHPARIVVWAMAIIIMILILIGIFRGFQSRDRDDAPGPIKSIELLNTRRALPTLAVVGYGVCAPALLVSLLPTSTTSLPMLLQELPKTYLLVFAGIFLLLMGNLINARMLNRGHGLQPLPFVWLTSVFCAGLVYFFHHPFLPQSLLFLLPLSCLLAIKAWKPASALSKLAVIAVLLSTAVPSLQRMEHAFQPRQDFKQAAELIRANKTTGRTIANFVLPMWDREGIEYYLGSGTANGILSPSQIPPAASLPNQVNFILTRQAFDSRAAFLEIIEQKLRPEFQITSNGEIFKRVYVAVFERKRTRE